MPIARRLYSSLLAVLLILSGGLIAAPALGAGSPGLGTDPGRGTIVASDLDVDQVAIQAAAMPAVRSIRAQMYDDKEVLFNGQPLYRAVDQAGLSRSEYINGVSWDTNLEKSAIQRAYEQNIVWGHVRPDGSSYKEADLLGKWPGEILTTQADIAVAIADVEKGSWAGERDDLIRYNGAFNNATGHLYNLINPSYKSFGFARVGNVTVGWMSTSRSSDTRGTQLDGNYTFETAVSSSNMSNVDGDLDVDSSLTAGETGTAVVTGTARSMYWLPAIPVEVEADYSSSNSNVLKINDDGSYTAVGNGSATVTATTATGQDYTARVTVTGNLVQEPAKKNSFYLTDSWSSLAINNSFVYGRAGDEVYVGDWNGDGRDTLGVRRGKTFFLNDSLRGGNADHEFMYGRQADEVLIGDWNGNGEDTISVRRDATYFINDVLIGGNANRFFDYGYASDEALVGDWDGDGYDTVSLRRGTSILLNNSRSDAVTSRSVSFGLASDRVFVGDWNGDGIDTPGLNRLD